MNPIRSTVGANAVAIYAMYLMNGYQEAASGGRGLSELQEQRGHLGVAEALAIMAVVVAEYLDSPDVTADADGYPGVFEYEILEPLGQWLHANSTCGPIDFRAELDLRFRAWINDERLQETIDQMELARMAVEARTAYRKALRELESATASHAGGWSRPVRSHVEELIDMVGRMSHLHPTTSLQALLAVAGGRL